MRSLTGCQGYTSVVPMPSYVLAFRFRRPHLRPVPLVWKTSPVTMRLHFSRPSAIISSQNCTSTQKYKLLENVYLKHSVQPSGLD